MNKKLWVGFIVVFVVLILTNFAIHVGILSSTYHSDEMKSMVRPDSEQKTYIHFISAVFVAFFFTLIFSKGYQGKGMVEGIRYGFYVGMMMSIPMAYDTYAAMPIPYHLALTWFICGVIQYIILGIVVAMVFGKTTQTQMSA